MFLKICFFITCLFLHFKKRLKILFDYMNFIQKEFSLYSIFFNFFSNSKKKLFKSENLNSFLYENKKYWSNKKFTRTRANKKILIESFVNQPAYTMSNAIIGLYLKKIFNYELIGVIRSGDYVAKSIFQSYGINKIIYLKSLNLFQRVSTIIIALRLIKNYQKIEDFCKIKFNGISVGLSAYDSYIRYTGRPSIDYINSELVYFLSNSIGSVIFFEDLIKKNKVTYSVQAETAFSPSNNLFQACLKNKIKVFSRLGTNSFSIRLYKKWKARFFYRANFAHNIFNKIYLKHKKKCIKRYDRFVNEEKKIGKFGYDVTVSDNIIKKKEIDKIRLKKLFNWDGKKIGVIFLHHFIDGNFHCGPRKSFRDNYSWARFTLNLLPKIKNVNWIIKPHPAQYVYKTKDNLEREIDNLVDKYKNIRLFPKHYHQSSLLKIADFAITSHGTVAVEYLAHGINSVYCDNSFYSNLNFMKMIKGKSNYLKSLSNLNNLKKPKRDLIEKCKTFLYIRHHLVKSDCSLLADHSITRNLDRETFWKKNITKLRKFKFENDELYQMFVRQLESNLEHTINFNKLKMRKHDVL